MQVSVRSYLTAGVAVLGAGAVALTPVQPIAAPTALAPAAAKAVAVSLAASIDPITPIINTIQATFTNTATLLSDWVQAPFPIASTVVQNWLYYLNELPNIGGIVTQMFTAVTGGIQAPFDPGSISEGGAGNPPAGVANGDNISTLPLIPPDGSTQLDLYQVLPLVPGGPEFLTSQQGLVNFLQTPVSGALLGLVGPVVAPIVALGNGISGAFAALQASDWATAINDLINIPTNMINAFLNGGVTLDLTSVFKSSLPSSVTSFGLNLGGLLTAAISPTDPTQSQLGGVGWDSLALQAAVFGSTLVDPGIPIGLAGGLVSLTRYVAQGMSQLPQVSTAAAKAPVRGPAAARAAAATPKAAAAAAAKPRSAAAVRHAK